MKIYNIFVIIIWLIIIITYCCFLIKLRKEIDNYHRLRRLKKEENEEDKNV